MDRTSHFVITYRDPEKDDIISVRAGTVEDSPLGISFIAVSGFQFDSSAVVIDPAQENLRQRLRHTRTLHLPLYRVLAIQEIGPETEGLKLTGDRTNLVVFPSPRGGP